MSGKTEGIYVENNGHRMELGNFISISGEDGLVLDPYNHEYLMWPLQLQIFKKNVTTGVVIRICGEEDSNKLLDQTLTIYTGEENNWDKCGTVGIDCYSDAAKKYESNALLTATND